MAAFDTAAFSIQLQGFTPANRDATIRLRNEATGAVVERQPFLDGSLLIRDLEPGPYEVQVLHPNLIQPIDVRRVRLFPQPAPTFVPILVPADLFRDSPIRDVPDADLRPIQQAATAVRDGLRPIGAKGPGEAIRAADWNALAGGVIDLAGAVLELTQLVSPRGHDHPEIAEKIAEVQANLRRFAEAFGRSLVELRREIETLSLRRNVTEVLTAGGASDDVRVRVLDRVMELERLAQADTPLFTQRLATVGTLLQTEINNLAVAQGANAETFLGTPAVQALQGTARSYVEAGVQTRPEAELLTYQRTTTAAGGVKLGRILGG